MLNRFTRAQSSRHEVSWGAGRSHEEAHFIDGILIEQVPKGDLLVFWAELLPELRVAVIEGNLKHRRGVQLGTDCITPKSILSTSRSRGCASRALS